MFDQFLLTLHGIINILFNINLEKIFFSPGLKSYNQLLDAPCHMDHCQVCLTCHVHTCHNYVMVSSIVSLLLP